MYNTNRGLFSVRSGIMFTFPHDFIIYINGVLLALLLVVIYRGYKRGLLLQLVDLVSILVSFIIAWLFSPIFVKIFSFVSINPTSLSAIDKSINDGANQLIWFGILFIVVRIALMIITPLASLISKMPLVKQVNSVAGGLFSIVVYFVYVMLIIFFLTLPIVKNGQEIISGTVLKPIQEVSQPIFTLIDSELNNNAALQSIINNQRLTQEQEEQVVSWLKERGFTQAAIEEFLSKYE